MVLLNLLLWFLLYSFNSCKKQGSPWKLSCKNYSFCTKKWNDMLWVCIEAQFCDKQDDLFRIPVTRCMFWHHVPSSIFHSACHNSWERLPHCQRKVLAEPQESETPRSHDINLDTFLNLVNDETDQKYISSMRYLAYGARICMLCALPSWAPCIMLSFQLCNFKATAQVTVNRLKWDNWQKLTYWHQMVSLCVLLCTQEGHVKEIKLSKRLEKHLIARFGVQISQMDGLYAKLVKRELTINTFCQTLCRIVEEHDETEWASLIKDLYMIYVRQVHRIMKAEGFETEEQILHQRYTILRLFVFNLLVASSLFTPHPLPPTRSVIIVQWDIIHYLNKKKLQHASKYQESTLWCKYMPSSAMHRPWLVSRSGKRNFALLFSLSPLLSFFLSWES